MSNNSQQPANRALEAHEKRYGKDLTYLLKRLDEMDSVIRQQDRLISRITLVMTDLVETVKDGLEIGKRPRIEGKRRGNCRILKFTVRN